MNKKLRKILRPAIIAVSATTIVAALSFAAKNDFGLGRNIEILVNMMRELSFNYVDPTDPDKLMQDAADGMVRSLDPYTELMPEEEMSQFEILTTGKYGGIGSLIRKRGDYVIIAQPYKGSPADRAGFRIGDRIIAIDGKDTKGMTISEVSANLKGDPNTTVHVTLEQLIGGKQETFTLRRERIAIPGVPYAGFVSDSIGYIQHSDFSEGCYDEMRSALERLRATGRLRGLILDYRGNGGGILQEAVKIVSMFVPKGTEVVSTKGRSDASKNTFRTSSEPVMPDIPIVVLVNGSTASAAEIVSGSLQDLDRAVLIGRRTFGKGLVQTTRPTGYNTYLKMTTAKYYIPSGRCIQAVDYSSRDSTGAVKFIPDSLIREFKTKGGRKVYDGAGIMPDIKSETEYISRFAVTLYAMGYIEDFVDEYMKKHHADKIDNRTFSITAADYADFVKFMQDKDVPYESETRRTLKILEEATKSDRYTDLAKEIARLSAELKDDKQTNLETYRDEIIDAINSNIILRFSYMEGVTEHGLADDKDVKQAVSLLSDKAEYSRIIRSQDTERK